MGGNAYGLGVGFDGGASGAGFGQAKVFGREGPELLRFVYAKQSSLSFRCRRPLRGGARRARLRVDFAVRVPFGVSDRVFAPSAFRGASLDSAWSDRIVVDVAPVDPRALLLVDVPALVSGHPSATERFCRSCTSMDTRSTIQPSWHGSATKSWNPCSKVTATRPILSKGPNQRACTRPWQPRSKNACNKFARFKKKLAKRASPGVPSGP